jgi:hypothetical protein
MDVQPNHVLLQPYRPTPADPFDAVKAAHLLNRAGFGGTTAEIGKVLELGPAKAVDWLLDFKDQSAQQQGKDVPDLSSIDGYAAGYKDAIKQMMGKSEEEKRQIRMKVQMANGTAIRATVAWWLRRMAYGPHPLQEKLTLFWHGHFTTSDKDERSASFMWNQNELLRANAAGNFRTFVRAISRDPAMLDYLNNNSNRKQHPNENYARELMELFTLGIGNYTETDVKECARAFTGFAHDGDDFIFRRGLHDTDPKTVLGETGNFDGDSVVDVILSKPACGKFVAGKLFRFFVQDDADDTLITAQQGVLRPRRDRVADQEPDPAAHGHDPPGGPGDAAGQRAALHAEADGAGAVPAAQCARLAGRADVDQHQHAAGPREHGRPAAGRPAAPGGRQPAERRGQLGRPGARGRLLAEPADPTPRGRGQEEGADRRRVRRPLPRGRRPADGAADRGDAGVPTVLKVGSWELGVES